MCAGRMRRGWHGVSPIACSGGPTRGPRPMISLWSSVGEEGEDVEATTTVAAVLGMVPLPWEWSALAKVLEGKPIEKVAVELDKPIADVDDLLSSETFQFTVAVIERAIAARIARGEFGITATFKLEAPGAVERIVHLSKKAKDERIRLQANTEIVKQSGFQPPQPIVTESVERLIDAMTAEEAAKFAESGEFPERFRDQMARLATSVLREQERKLSMPAVEQITKRPVIPTEILE